jgi:hypothetical protein
MKDPHVERLAFIRVGDDGMAVEMVGKPQTLQSMVKAAITDNPEIRKLLIPMVFELMHDKSFMLSLLDDVVDDITGNSSDDEDTLELD